MNYVKCKYNENLETKNFNTKSDIKILQLFGENKNIEIGNKNYPINYGSLYFIGINTKYKVNEMTVVNEISVDEKYFKNISDLMNFRNEFNKLFNENKGFYKKISHYKVIDSRFKIVNNLQHSSKPMSLALLTTKIIEIINYGVV